MARKKTTRSNAAGSTLLKTQRILAIILLCALILICVLVLWGILRGSNGKEQGAGERTTSVSQERSGDKKAPKYSFSEELKERSAEERKTSAGGIVLESLQSQEQSPQKSESAPSPKTGGYYVQIGAFSEHDHADRLRAQMILQNYSVRMMPSGKVYVVQLGPYPSREAAQKVQQELPALGIKESILKQD